MSPKNFLNNITIPSPCTADWDSMIGNEQVRFCEHCSHEVHYLSLLTRNQAQRLLARSNGRLCVRYHHDATGRPITLPVQQRLHRIGRRVSRLAAGAFTATLSVTSAVAQGSIGPRSGNLKATDVPNATQPNTRWILNSSVAGTITDQNGGVISGATISLLNEKSNAALYVSTGPNGQFRIDSLQEGVYKLRIEAPGFDADQTDALYVQANSEARFNRTLSVTRIEETVIEEIGIDNLTLSVRGGMVAFVAPEDPFVRAAQEDDLETLTSLIAGKDVNLRDKRSGTTALEHAVKNANREMVQLLLSAGADVNTKNEDGETVLMMLDEDSTSDLVWDLLNAGADVNQKTESAITALMQVAGSNSLEALRTLLDGGADVNMKDKAGRTALMLAASGGFVNNVRALVLAGADINATDEDNLNALAYATENDHAPVVRFLRSKGALEAVAKVAKDQ